MQIMEYNVHAGHTKQSGRSPGAYGILSESTENRKIKDEVIRLLRARGHRVNDCTSEGDSLRDNLYRIVAKCNSRRVDLDLSIHLNCYDEKAHGTEAYVYSKGSSAYTPAARIVNNIASLGYANRGVKEGPHLYFIRMTNSKAILVEAFFCDNKEDCDRYDAKKVAFAIAKGVDPSIQGSVSPNTAGPVPVAPPKPSKLKEDGEVGVETNKALQRELGMDIIDGEISWQYIYNKKYYPAMVGGWEWLFRPNSSPTIVALQDLIGAPKDGIAGETTAYYWQIFLNDHGANLKVDKVFGEKSALALQKWLNG